YFVSFNTRFQGSGIVTQKSLNSLSDKELIFQYPFSGFRDCYPIQKYCKFKKYKLFCSLSVTPTASLKIAWGFKKGCSDHIRLLLSAHDN
ncbi:MAG: hypothetical protein QXW81_05355, partial [Archaeoglobaceae archaeon]